MLARVRIAIVGVGLASVAAEARCALALEAHVVRLASRAIFARRRAADAHVTAFPGEAGRARAREPGPVHFASAAVLAGLASARIRRRAIATDSPAAAVARVGVAAFAGGSAAIPTARTAGTRARPSRLVA